MTATHAAAQAVDGFYLGTSVAVNTGNFNVGFGDYSYAGSSLGIFAGYNRVVGDWVLGAELAYQSEAISDIPFETYGASDILDLKARFGKNFGQTYVYGALGYSSASATYDNSNWGKMDGVNYGVGFETSIRENVFVGGEILHRDFSNDNTASNYFDDSPLTTASIRLGIRF